jgi:hypothetical protein
MVDLVAVLVLMQTQEGQELLGKETTVVQEVEERGLLMAQGEAAALAL